MSAAGWCPGSGPGMRAAGGGDETGSAWPGLPRHRSPARPARPRTAGRLQGAEVPPRHRFLAAETPARRPSILRTMRMAAGWPGGFTPTVVPHRRIPVRQVLHGIRHDFRLSAWERCGRGRRLPHAGRVRLLGHDARRLPSGAATHRGSRPFPIPLIPAVCVQACRTTHMLPPFLHGVKSCFGGLITTAGRSGAESRILDRDAMDRMLRRLRRRRRRRLCDARCPDHTRVRNGSSRVSSCAG